MLAGIAIEVCEVTKTYGEGTSRVEALRGVNLSIAPGEFVAIVGPSGCGKSTLMHLLAGLDTSTTGMIRVFGVDLGQLDEDGRTAFRGQYIGVVFQSFNLLDILSAEENVALPLILAGFPSGEASQRARSVLDRVGLAHRARHFPAQLSGGEQQRVAVARAIVADPVLLIADEPTGSLDSENGKRIFELLQSLAENQRTVLLVTHDPLLAARANRSIRLRDGVVEASTSEAGEEIECVCDSREAGSGLMHSGNLLGAPLGRC